MRKNKSIDDLNKQDFLHHEHDSVFGNDIDERYRHFYNHITHMGFEVSINTVNNVSINQQNHYCLNIENGNLPKYNRKFL